MRTEKQIEASRANGAKSMGPITPEGKAHSSQNAYIHGLTALIGFKAEGRSELALLAQDYLDHHQPVGPAETHCVEILIACHWRQNRAWSLETNIFDDENDRIAHGCLREHTKLPECTIGARTWKSLSDNSSSLALLIRYEAGLSRRYFKALKTLSELQAARRAAPAPDAPEPLPLTPDDPIPTENSETNPSTPQPQSPQPLPAPPLEPEIPAGPTAPLIPALATPQPIPIRPTPPDFRPLPIPPR